MNEDFHLPFSIGFFFFVFGHAFSSKLDVSSHFELMILVDFHSSFSSYDLNPKASLFLNDELSSPSLSS
jgi:hypothetical protein